MTYRESPAGPEKVTSINSTLRCGSVVYVFVIVNRPAASVLVCR